MKCKQCGAEFTGNYCPECGAKNEELYPQIVPKEPNILKRNLTIYNRVVDKFSIYG